MRRALVPATIVLVAILAVPAAASAAKVELVGTFSGKAEKPTAGDPDGTGKAAVTVDTKSRAVCWKFTGIKNIGKPVAAHIHKGKKGSAGAIVVDFSTPSYKSKGCVTATKALAKDLAANPASYYANIHTADFPGGAIRAQLKAAPKKT